MIFYLFDILIIKNNVYVVLKFSGEYSDDYYCCFMDHFILY